MTLSEEDTGYRLSSRKLFLPMVWVLLLLRIHVLSKLWLEVGADGNITSKLVSYEDFDQAAQGKSAHCSSTIVDTGYQRGYEHTGRYRSVGYPPELAYVAPM